mgnify:CR=1 FL=1
MKSILLFILSTVILPAHISASATKQPDVHFLHRAHEALTSVIIHDIFSPPVSSRIYLYAHVAAYETLVKADVRFQSLHGQVPDFPVIPAPAEKISYSLAAIHAFMLKNTAACLMPSPMMS